MRNHRQRLNDAHVRLSDWADWMIRHMVGSKMEYASETALGRLARGEASGSGGDPHRYVEMMPPRISRIDRIIGRLPKHLQTVVLCKYWPEAAIERYRVEFKHTGQWVEGQKMALYSLITGKGSSTYYRLWDKAREIVANGGMVK